MPSYLLFHQNIDLRSNRQTSFKGNINIALQSRDYKEDIVNAKNLHNHFYAQITRPLLSDLPKWKHVFTAPRAITKRQVNAKLFVPSNKCVHVGLFGIEIKI